MASVDGPNPSRPAREHASARDDDSTQEMAERYPGQALAQRSIEQGDAALLRAHESIAHTADAVERSRRHVEHTQRELERRRTACTGPEPDPAAGICQGG